MLTPHGEYLLVPNHVLACKDMVTRIDFDLWEYYKDEVCAFLGLTVKQIKARIDWGLIIELNI